MTLVCHLMVGSPYKYKLIFENKQNRFCNTGLELTFPAACRRKLLSWLVWGPLLLALTVLLTPCFLAGSMLWVLVCLFSPAQRNLTRISLDRSGVP